MKRNIIYQEQLRVEVAKGVPLTPAIQYIENRKEKVAQQKKRERTYNNKIVVNQWTKLTYVIF
jgi:hypothetical protein